MVSVLSRVPDTNDSNQKSNRQTLALVSSPKNSSANAATPQLKNELVALLIDEETAAGIKLFNQALEKVSPGFASFIDWFRTYNPTENSKLGLSRGMLHKLGVRLEKLNDAQIIFLGMALAKQLTNGNIQKTAQQHATKYNIPLPQARSDVQRIYLKKIAEQNIPLQFTANEIAPRTDEDFKQWVKRFLNPSENQQFKEYGIKFPSIITIIREAAVDVNQETAAKAAKYLIQGHYGCDVMAWLRRSGATGDGGGLPPGPKKVGAGQEDESQVRAFILFIQKVEPSELATWPNALKKSLTNYLVDPAKPLQPA